MFGLSPHRTARVKTFRVSVHKALGLVAAAGVVPVLALLLCAAPLAMVGAWGNGTRWSVVRTLTLGVMPVSLVATLIAFGNFTVKAAGLEVSQQKLLGIACISSVVVSAVHIMSVEWGWLLHLVHHAGSARIVIHLALAFVCTTALLVSTLPQHDRVGTAMKVVWRFTAHLCTTVLVWAALGWTWATFVLPLSMWGSVAMYVASPVLSAWSTALCDSTASMQVADFAAIVCTLSDHAGAMATTLAYVAAATPLHVGLLFSLDMLHYWHQVFRLTGHSKWYRGLPSHFFSYAVSPFLATFHPWLVDAGGTCTRAARALRFHVRQSRCRCRCRCASRCPCSAASSQHASILPTVSVRTPPSACHTRGSSVDSQASSMPSPTMPTLRGPRWRGTRTTRSSSCAAPPAASKDAAADDEPHITPECFQLMCLLYQQKAPKIFAQYDGDRQERERLRVGVKLAMMWMCKLCSLVQTTVLAWVAVCVVSTTDVSWMWWAANVLHLSQAATVLSSCLVFFVCSTGVASWMVRHRTGVSLLHLVLFELDASPYLIVFGFSSCFVASCLVALAGVFWVA